MINKSLLEKRFSQHASTYDKFAHVQKEMAKRLIKQVLSLTEEMGKNNLRILEIGCGTGYISEQLVEQFPTAHITAIDLAPGMIEQVKTKVRSPRVSFRCGDAEKMEWNEKFDIIISNATFQWFEQLPETIYQLMSILNKGVLCFTTFGKHTFYELHRCHQLAKQNLKLEERYSKSTAGPLFESFNQLSRRIAAIFEEKLEFVQIVGEEWEHDEWYPSVNDFFRSVKKTGASSINENSIQRPSFWKEVIRLYETTYEKNGYIRATYHPILMTLKKE